MMKSNKNLLIGLLGLLLGCTACVDDNSTVYDANRLNRVAIEGLQDKYSVLLYDRLQITPDIQTTHGDDSRLSYIWYAYTAVTSRKADTLSYEKVLDVLAEPSILTPGEDYTLTLRVTDDESGVFYQKDMKLEITTQFTKGTIFLCEEGGEAEINFMQDNAEHTFLENVYEEANKELVGRNPKKILSINPNQYAPFMKQEYIWCEDENGGMVASPLSFEKVMPMRQTFDVTPEVEILSPEYYFKGGMIEYIIVNGALHKRATNMQAVTWEPALVLMTTPADYDIAPDVLFPTGTPVFYDERYGRLITHAAWNMAALKPLMISATDPKVFDPNNVGEDLVLKCWGRLSEPKTGAWMLLQNTQDKRFWFYKFSVTGNEFSSISKQEVTEAIAPNLKNAIAFAANPQMNDVFMYATPTGIYSIAANQLSASSSNLEVLQVDMAAERMEVTDMKFLDITVPAPTPEDPNATQVIAQVRAFVRDLDLSEKRGGAIFFEVNTTGGVHLDELFKKTGFCDKVIDIDEKYN